MVCKFKFVHHSRNKKQIALYVPLCKEHNNAKTKTKWEKQQCKSKFNFLIFCPHYLLNSTVILFLTLCSKMHLEFHVEYLTTNLEWHLYCLQLNKIFLI